MEKTIPKTNYIINEKNYGSMHTLTNKTNKTNKSNKKINSFSFNFKLNNNI